MKKKLYKVGIQTDDIFTEFGICTSLKNALKAKELLKKLCWNEKYEDRIAIVEYPISLDVIEISGIRIELDQSNNVQTTVLSQKDYIETVLNNKTKNSLSKNFQKELEGCNKLLRNIFLRDYASSICTEFENLLERHHIQIPDPDRTEKENKANIYGTTYAILEDAVSQILETLIDELKYNPLTPFNSELYSDKSYFI